MTAPDAVSAAPRLAERSIPWLLPALVAILPNGTWRTTLTFLDVGAGSEPIDGQVQIACDDDASVAVQYEYDQMIRTTVRLNAVPGVITPPTLTLSVPPCRSSCPGVPARARPMMLECARGTRQMFYQG